MAYRTGVSETTEERRRVPLLQVALAALLCACFVAANLAGIAAPAAAEALATTAWQLTADGIGDDLVFLFLLRTGAMPELSHLGEP